MHVTRPARGEIVAIAHDERRTRIAWRIAMHAAGFAPAVRGIERDVVEVRGRCERTRDLRLHATVAARFAGLLAIGAVVVAVPPAPGVARQAPRRAFEFPGERGSFTPEQH